jgi:FkbM family methyltransferase
MAAAVTKRIDVVKKALPQPVRTALKKALYDLRERNFKPYLKRKTVAGEVFDFLIGDTQGRGWYDNTDPLSIELRFARDHMIKPGDVVFDCGAHHGYATVLFSKWVGDKGKVVAFEALPRNCDILAKNVELNGLTNVILERKAVGATRGQISIDGVSDSTVIFSKQGINVEMTRLDDYAHLNAAFVKFDVEGFEYQALQGAQNILSQTPKLVVELHTDKLSKYGASVEKVLNTIGLDRYRLWIQWNDSEEPEEYDNTVAITERVHLFCFPIRDENLG